MAKKAKAEAVEVAPQEVVAKPTPKKETKPAKSSWEIKDRRYHLIGRGDPLTYVLASKSTPRKPLLWFDEEKGYNREIRYASNQKKINLYKNYYLCIIQKKDISIRKKTTLLKLKKI